MRFLLPIFVAGVALAGCDTQTPPQSRVEITNFLSPGVSAQNASCKARFAEPARSEFKDSGGNIWTFLKPDGQGVVYCRKELSGKISAWTEAGMSDATHKLTTVSDGRPAKFEPARQ